MPILSHRSISKWGLCFKRETHTHTHRRLITSTPLSLHRVEVGYCIQSAPPRSTRRNTVTKISDPSTFSRTAHFQPLSFFSFFPSPWYPSAKSEPHNWTNERWQLRNGLTTSKSWRGRRHERWKTNIQQWRNLTPEEEQEQEVLGGRRSSVG